MTKGIITVDSRHKLRHVLVYNHRYELGDLRNIKRIQLIFIIHSYEDAVHESTLGVFIIIYYAYLLLC